LPGVTGASQFPDIQFKQAVGTILLCFVVRFCRGAALMNKNGSVVNGTADLVIKNENGIIIIDHKTDQISNTSESFEKYLPQLMTYANELSKELEEAVAVGIHWIRNGELVLCELNNN